MRFTPARLERRFPVSPGSLFLLVLSALAFIGASCKEKPTPVPQNPLAVTDISGRPVDPLGNDALASVFFFVAPECPIANRYAPEILSLHDRFSTNGILFWLVYSDPDVPSKRIEAHLREFALPGMALRDPRHHLARLAKARVTPDVAVFQKGRRLVYHGRIDDRYVALGSDRGVATRNDLRDVLQAIVAREPVTTVSSPGVGCRIPGVE
jgi:hypothetical protein